MKHFNIRVFGLVQGVSFRYYARQHAGQLDIKGFIKNNPGGSVYIEAEGEDKKLDEFVLWCQDGSESAKVDKVDVQIGDLKNFSDFTIL